MNKTLELINLEIESVSEKIDKLRKKYDQTEKDSKIRDDLKKETLDHYACSLRCQAIVKNKLTRILKHLKEDLLREQQDSFRKYPKI